MKVYDASVPAPEVRNDVTLLDLMNAVKEEADMVGSNFLDDKQLVRWINVELSELYDLLISKFSDHLVAVHSGLPVSGEFVVLPGNFYSNLGIFLYDGSEYYRVRKAAHGDLDRWANASSVQTPTDGAYHYRIMGNRITILPVPPSTYTVTMYYIPVIPKLRKPEERVHFTVPIGWEDFVVAGVAARALAKEESDPSYQLQRKAYIKQHILEFAERDEGQPDAVRDEYRRFGDDYGYFDVDE